MPFLKLGGDLSGVSPLEKTYRLILATGLYVVGHKNG